MGYSLHWKGLRGWLLLSLSLLAAGPASAGDLIQRELSTNALDEHRHLVVGPLTQGVLARETVRIDASVLAAEPQSLWLELTSGEHRLAFLTEIERKTGGQRVWRGRFAEDDPEYVSITLSMADGIVLGSFEGAAVHHVLRPLGRDDSVLITASPGHVPRCQVGAEGVPVPAVREELSALEASGHSGEAEAATAKDRTLHILVLYSPTLTQRWGGKHYAVAYAHHSVDALNTAFRNSQIDGAAVLAGVMEWDPRGSNPNLTHYPDRAAADASVRAVRDQTGADLVVVLTDSDSSYGGCGYANLMLRSSMGPQFAARAFSATNVDCEGFDHLTFAHEIGHNLGAQHPPGPTATSPDVAVSPYSFGHYGDGINTIMAPGAHHLLFSNPRVRFRGARAGIEGERDNARALQQTLPIAAAFRTGGSKLPRNNVPPPVPPPPIEVPASPTDLRGSVLSATEVELRWKANGSGQIAFRIEGRPHGGDYAVVAEVPQNTDAHVVGGLQPSTTYTFRVLAIGVQANSPHYTNEVTLTTADVAPAVPTGLVAEPASSSALHLHWDAVERASGYEVKVRTADPAADRGPESIALGAEGAVVTGAAAATPYTVRVRAVNAAGPSAWSEPASATTLGTAGPCTEDADTLCLLGGRFEVRARWRNPHPPFGHGAAAAKPAPGSERTGLFTFFDPDNVELVVKMLDGRATNGAFWHFYGALSDVEYWVTVRDTAEGGSRTYHNEPFSLCGRGDTKAFVTGPETPEKGAPAVLPTSGAVASQTLRATAAAETACIPGEEALCLADGRFRVEVEWENPRIAGHRGTGKVFAGLDGERSGHFWFFREDNLELSVKILDGRAINGHFWIFWGGLSDVGYTIRVTDAETGVAYDFVNPPFTLCGGAVTEVL